jgi:palmitoyltransferase
MAVQFVSKLAIPAVVLLIGFLSYVSQLLFRGLEPGPLTSRDSIKFNILVLCIWIAYARACTVDPGIVPSDWTPDVEVEKKNDIITAASRQRVCRKCSALKPPRSHHCKICQRYDQVH